MALSQALPAQAADLFTPPEGCEVFLTVQGKSCKVSHHYRCVAEPAGHQWRVDFDQTGPYFASQINREGEWLTSTDLRSGYQTRLAPGAADPASLSALFDGADSYDFQQLSSSGELNRYQGFDTLTGKKMVIDGVELEETSFTFRETDKTGAAIGTAKGNEFVHRGWRLFFSGPSLWEGADGETAAKDYSPVRFDEPGDAGFRSTKPEYDCSVEMAALR